MSAASELLGAVRRELASTRRQQEQLTMAEQEIMWLEAVQMGLFAEAHYYQWDQLEAAGQDQAWMTMLDVPQVHEALGGQLDWLRGEPDRVTERNRSTSGRQSQAGPAVQISAAPRPPPPPPPRENGFDCSVCFDKFPLHALGLDLPCDDSHRACRDCLSRHIEAKLGEQQWPIACPGCSANDAAATTITRDMAELILTEELLRRWDRVEVMPFSNEATCPSCRITIPVDREDFEAAKTLKCRFCRHEWCGRCDATVPAGRADDHTCGDAETERAMVAAGQKRCPGCRNRYEHGGGCFHMTCARPGCNTHWCASPDHPGLDGVLLVRTRDAMEVQRALVAHYTRGHRIVPA